jgi:hypothetical protein
MIQAPESTSAHNQRFTRSLRLLTLVGTPAAFRFVAQLRQNTQNFTVC